MEKRKITKFRPLCPSDISPYKGATKQEVPPLYKGRLGGVCAFTLVELIVVVTILAILGTIAFVFFQSYSKNARDTKRITEMKQLFSKLEIEHIKGTPYADLINDEQNCHTGNVLGQSNVEICQGPVNFGMINENENSFKDGEKDYIFAYTTPIMVQQQDGTSRSMEFLQGATTLENGTNKVVGDYYTSNESDAKGLVKKDEVELVDGGNSGGNSSTSSSSSGGDSTLDNCPSGDCGVSPQYACDDTTKPANNGHIIFTSTSAISENQVWNKDAQNCGYTCNDDYTGSNCNTPPEGCSILLPKSTSDTSPFEITGNYPDNWKLFNGIKDYSSNPELDPFSLGIGENPIILNMGEIKKVKKIIYYETCIEYACYYYTNMGKSVMISQDGTNFSYMDKNYFTTTEHVEVNMYFNMPSNISTREIEEGINVQYISFMTGLGQEEALIGHEADIYISCE